MAHRPDLNSLGPADRSALVALMLQYLTDAVVNQHPLIQHSGEHLFTGHRAYIAALEAWLGANGGARFVPLPEWDPAKPIPPEFDVVKPHDDGTPRTPMANLNPNTPKPAQFAYPALCSFATAEDLGNAVNPWHGTVHGAVGGTMTNFNEASAAPIFWCWHGYVDTIYEDFGRCQLTGGSDIKQVPGWFGAEDQGADVAIAEIHGHGTRDLIVFHVDNPGGENHGYYRIGWHLDAQGNVSHGWSDVKAVPGWFGAEDQGAGIAVADINGSGRPDLLVFHVDNPHADNHGYYRIGWDLDEDGDVGGGWSDIKPVPGWFGWENQGAGIATADINGSGQPDLLVFHIDNPSGENHGYYRIGWNLDANGNVTGGWTPVMAIPGWFGAEDQGAGVALADIDGDGRPDLVAFHTDNPNGDNHGYYRIGWSLDTSGVVGRGWSPISAVPGWFGWENQGAGVALADINGNARQDLIVFHVDNPGGENHGYYRIVFDLTERPTPVPPAEDPQCTDLRGEIDALTDEIRSLQEELQSAAPGEKAAIVRQIRALRRQIAELRRRGMQLGCAL